jgi:hypothetical protein
MATNRNPMSFVASISHEQLKAICKRYKIPASDVRNYVELVLTGRAMSKRFYELLSKDRRYGQATSAILSQLCEPLLFLFDWQR